MALNGDDPRLLTAWLWTMNLNSNVSKLTYLGAGSFVQKMFERRMLYTFLHNTPGIDSKHSSTKNLMDHKHAQDISLLSQRNTRDGPDNTNNHSNGPNYIRFRHALLYYLLDFKLDQGLPLAAPCKGTRSRA